MIRILEKHDCCGCSACVQKCPKRCISLREDEEGFLYPIIDENTCVDCGLCERVCPIINQRKSRLPLHVYAAVSANERVRLQSSSGGIFTQLAVKVLDEGGVVFGACFDENWEVNHDYTENIESLGGFRGSKYVQSRMENNYRKADFFLRQGRKVLFSGTPCQIAGLKCFLRKEYANLITVDFVCHGVPSPKVWRMYLDETVTRQCGTHTLSSIHEKRNTIIESVSFRDKRLGWKKFSFSLALSIPNGSGEKKSVFLSDVFTENLFMKGFLDNLFLRPSCYCCSAKSGKSGSDITIADFWGIDRLMPDFDDDKGISLVLVNTVGGGHFFSSLDMEVRESSLDVVKKCNSNYIESVVQHHKRNTFFTMLTEGSSVCKAIDTSLKFTLDRMLFTMSQRILKKLSKIIVSCIPLPQK